eukprot:Hpha_TRINITY_DN16293_c2_g2::TRINITY_DN16293_c2_g2_i1::g.14369::m.14369
MPPQWGADFSPVDSDMSHMSFRSNSASPPKPVPFAGCGERRKPQHHSWSRSTDREEITHFKSSSRPAQHSIYDQARAALDRARNAITSARSNLDYKREQLNQMFSEKDLEETQWLKKFKHELQQPYKRYKAMPRTPEVEAKIAWLNAVWSQVEDLQQEEAAENSSTAPSNVPAEKAPAPTPQQWEEATRAQPRMSLPVPRAGRSQRREKEKSMSVAPHFSEPPPADDQMPEDTPQQEEDQPKQRAFLQLEETKKASKRKAPAHEHAPSPKKERKAPRAQSRGAPKKERAFAVGDPVSCLRSDGSWNDAHVESIDEDKGYVIRLHTKERLKKVLTFDEAPEYLRRQDPKPEKPSRAKSTRARSQAAPAENRGKSRARSRVRASEAPNRGKSPRAKSPRGKSEARPKKDKSKPKAARSAYQFYSGMMMSMLQTQVLSENPEFTRRQAHGAAATRLGVAWNKEKVGKTDTYRRVMNEAAEDKERHKREMAEWKNSDSAAQEESKPRRREIHAVFDDDE